MSTPNDDCPSAVGAMHAAEAPSVPVPELEPAAVSVPAASDRTGAVASIAALVLGILSTLPVIIALAVEVRILLLPAGRLQPMNGIGIFVLLVLGGYLVVPAAIIAIMLGPRNRRGARPRLALWGMGLGIGALCALALCALYYFFSGWFGG